VFLRYLLGVLERLNPEQFELVILCTAAGRERMRPEISNDAIRLLVIPRNFSDMLEPIRDAGFDVLYHWEVGSDVNNYFLPFFRLAPVQCTSLGVLETSGIRQIDYYLSPDIVEPAKAQDHYSETLLRAITLLSYHTRLQLPSASKSREQFGFEKNQHLYFCPHKIQKFHPDMDPLIAGILQQDPQGIVVIPEDISGYAARNLHARFEKTIAGVSHRIIFVPYLKLPDYLSLTAAADVLLDPIYYGGGLTAYDGFSLNKPTVTLPTRFARGRFTYGLYRQMEMTDCVVTTPEEYVQQSVRLGSDRDYREFVLQGLQNKSDVLFEDMAIVREYERIFQDLVDEARLR
jgi:protein O-GlcNAc transferase